MQPREVSRCLVKLDVGGPRAAARSREVKLHLGSSAYHVTHSDLGCCRVEYITSAWLTALTAHTAMIGLKAITAYFSRLAG